MIIIAFLVRIPIIIWDSETGCDVGYTPSGFKISLN